MEEAWTDAERWLTSLEKDGFVPSNSEPTASPAPDGRAGARGNGDAPPRRSRRPTSVFDAFLVAFMSLRGPDRAVKVWNRMLALGLQPTQATWNAMLDGSRKVWDLESMEGIWRKMWASGAKPDIGCWTTRIHALTTRGSWQQGIQALNEMGRAWQDAAKEHLQSTRANLDRVDLSMIEDIGGVVKPTTATVNGVVDGLLRKGRLEEAHDVIAWATTLGIRPDTATYNTLLKYAIAKGGSKSALEIFKTMEESGLRPDIFTFTIVLGGFFGSYAAERSPPAEQAQAVAEIFAEMEAAGIETNVYSYGILIDNLLRRSGNTVAAKAVLAHMASKGVKATNHIITMFLTHHLSQRRPDMNAVDALWNEVQGLGLGMDAVLYDRFVHGYGSAGQVYKMMDVLEKMSGEGKAPSWDVLTVVMGALGRAQLWDDASLLVADVLHLRGFCRDGIRGTRGIPSETRFWELVRDMSRAGMKMPDGPQGGDPERGGSWSTRMR